MNTLARNAFMGMIFGLSCRFRNIWNSFSLSANGSQWDGYETEKKRQNVNGIQWSFEE